MTTKARLALAAGIAALAIPALAAAQSWGGDYQEGRGYDGRYAFRGYPEFRDEKAHVRAEIREGVEEGWLDNDDARQLYGQLWQVQRREFREFREHGWDLPGWDRRGIRERLNELDRSIDEARDRS